MKSASLLVFLLALCLSLTACGKKAAHVDAPDGVEVDTFPQTYPNPTTDPKPTWDGKTASPPNSL